MSWSRAFPPKRIWIFTGAGMVTGAIAGGYLGFITGRSDWSPPLDLGDLKTFVALSALAGVLPGAFTGLLLWPAMMRHCHPLPRMLVWGVLGGWLVIVLFFVNCFYRPPGIGGPVIYARDAGGLWDRMVDAVLVPVSYGGWLFAGLGIIAGAAASAGWWLLCVAIRWGAERRRKPP